MKKEERVLRVIARGEFSNHSHVITGEGVLVEQKNGKTFITLTENSNACLKHLLEKEWLGGKEVWTKEHTDIDLSNFPDQVRHGDVLLNKVSERTYEYIGQVEYDPYSELIKRVID